MKICILLFTILTSILNCTTSSSSTKNFEKNNTLTSEKNTSLATKKPNSNADFLSAYQKMITAIKTNDTLNFNQLIYSNYGLYIIENSGAMPQLSKIYNINSYTTKNKQLHFFDLAFDSISLLPVKESLPKVVCNTKIYSKEGCFYATENPLKDSQIWNYTQLNEKEIQAIQHITNTIQITVINTSSCIFYFSFIDHTWWLTFIDLRTPCEA